MSEEYCKSCGQEILDAEDRRKACEKVKEIEKQIRRDVWVKATEVVNGAPRWIFPSGSDIEWLNWNDLRSWITAAMKENLEGV